MTEKQKVERSDANIFAPKLYTVRKIPLSLIIGGEFRQDAGGYQISLEPDEEKTYNVRQQDSALLRQIRLITGKIGKFNPYIIFVNINISKARVEQIKRIVTDGFALNGKHFVSSERSASMTRNGILSFVDESIAGELDKRITMDLEFDKVVLSKYYSYRGLMLSSSHNIEGYLPKMIVVPDYFTTIPNQHIKYAEDVTTSFIDSNGNERQWTQKDIKSGYRDIEINAFDGCGFCHPAITGEISRRLGLSEDEQASSMIIRMPYIKGVIHELDYEAFYRERGVDYITDIWGVKYDFSEPMMILTEGMYKGYKYFNKYGDWRDWELYWEKFHKYEHCFGVAKWNFIAEREPKYTRGNYQVLQDLDLPYDKFRQLADYSIDWADKIINGDKIYTYCFLGLMHGKTNVTNGYIKAILKNPEMIKESSVRNHISQKLKKKIEDMMCGKIWLNATFKFLAPDLIMLMEWAGGLKPVGCLASDEFYSHNTEGAIIGERLIERNPHICRSEHVILKGVQNELINTYCSHLDNICMINCRSIVPARLNGAD